MSHYTAALVRDQAPFGMGGFVDRVLPVLSFVSDTATGSRSGSTTPKADLVAIHATSGLGEGTSSVMTDLGSLSIGVFKAVNLGV
jgi:hypothetical protein